MSSFIVLLMYLVSHFVINPPHCKTTGSICLSSARLVTVTPPSRLVTVALLQRLAVITPLAGSAPPLAVVTPASRFTVVTTPSRLTVVTPPFRLAVVTSTSRLAAVPPPSRLAAALPSRLAAALPSRLAAAPPSRLNFAPPVRLAAAPSKRIVETATPPSSSGNPGASQSERGSNRVIHCSVAATPPPALLLRLERASLSDSVSQKLAYPGTVMLVLDALT
ncbi:Uncharacterized protein Rs2_10430 [Raphanus sativus]|nr:Uncharacterized protein Rs2_10430 [Raphanus sativus]